MRFHHQDVSISLFFLGTAGVLYIISSKLQDSTDSISSSSTTDWVRKLFANLSGYAVVFIPGYLIIKYIQRINYGDYTNRGFLWPLIKACVYGQNTDVTGGELLLPTIESSAKSLHPDQGPSTFARNSILLLYCFLGLQSSYLMWGLLQEKIMTQKYNGKSFTDSQFLVFVNRILALVIAWVYISIYETSNLRKNKDGPLYKYSFCAFSNIMSSWFQYEALKFVSFPTQVLAKACKIIPVMLMGKLISKQTYEYYEYLTAVLISLGMILFLSGSSDYINVGHETSAGATTVGLSGLTVLILYMVFDSFTSNWQSALFKTYRVSSVRMMAGVNLFACSLTGITLIQQGSLVQSSIFIAEHKDFAFDCLLLSICSAVGQLFIYYTIEKFGPVVFIIIMTIRQALAVFLSCIFYQHPINAGGIIGVLLVFFALLLRTYSAYRIRQIKKKPSSIGINSGSAAKV